MHVISTADRLCVPDLVDATQRDAAASSSADIVVALSYFSWSGLPSLKILRQATTDYKCAHSEQLLARDDLRKTLLLPTPLSLVACPSLCVRDEALLLQAVLRRLSYSTHTKKDVVALLGSVRLYQLDEDSLDAPSFVARGGAAWPVVEHEDALQEGVTDVVRGGLSCLGVGAVGQPSLGSSPQRCSVVGRSGTALSDPRGNQNSYVISLHFRVPGHEWQLQLISMSRKVEALRNDDRDAVVCVDCSVTAVSTPWGRPACAGRYCLLPPRFPDWGGDRWALASRHRGARSPAHVRGCWHLQPHQRLGDG